MGHMARKTTYELKRKSQDPSYRRKEGNLPAKKYKHGNPTITRLSFEFTGGATKFIDLAQALSIANRKLFRQGAYYYVNSVEVYNNSDELVDILTIPDSWVQRNAYVRAKQVWDDMNDLVLQNQPSILPKYHDFKVFMTDLHRTTGTTAPSLHSYNAAATAYSPDDWQYSQMVSADDDGDVNQQADNFYLHMMGPNVGAAANWESVGIVNSYAQSRRQLPSGGTPVVEAANLQQDPIANLMDYSSEEQINDLITRLDEDNDQTPFDSNQYIGELGNSLQQVARMVTTATYGRTATAPGFCVPFGLLAIDSQVGSQDTFRVVVNVAPGTYNGVYAERV